MPITMKAARVNVGLTQQEAAEALEINKNTLQLTEGVTRMAEPRKPDKTYIGKKCTCHFYYGNRPAEERRVALEWMTNYLYKECKKQGVKI